jgi:hypothetical protein
MPVTGKPAIVAPKAERDVVSAVSNIRQRIEQIEALLLAIESQANQSSFTIGRSNATVTGLQAQITALGNSVDELDDLLAGADGLVVVAGGQLIVRTLQEGTNITITNPDGVDGDPVINATASGSGAYPFLTNELDDDILTEDGHRIRVE